MPRPPARRQREDAIEPWVEYMVSTKCGLTADQFRQVALGYRDNYMDNWAHYVIRAGEYQQIQTQYRDLLLNNEQKPEELFPTIKEKMDEVAKSVFAEYQNTPLGEDTLCAPLKR